MSVFPEKGCFRNTISEKIIYSLLHFQPLFQYDIHIFLILSLDQNFDRSS